MSVMGKPNNIVGMAGAEDQIIIKRIEMLGCWVAENALAELLILWIKVLHFGCEWTETHSGVIFGFNLPLSP